MESRSLKLLIGVDIYFGGMEVGWIWSYTWNQIRTMELPSICHNVLCALRAHRK